VLAAIQEVSPLTFSYCFTYVEQSRSRAAGRKKEDNKNVNRRSFLSPCLQGFLLPARAKPPQKLKLALNWKPDPQFGGFYAADYTQAGLGVEVLPGGAGTPTVQMIGSGAAQFGIVSADELLLARSRGNDVVALFAVYQSCPQGIMVHAERGRSRSGMLRTTERWRFRRACRMCAARKEIWLRSRKGGALPGGDISVFLSDPKFAQQCFVVSEPLAAKKKGLRCRCSR
jgi:NitT/TauT family transport system substrate-binding protein